MAVRKLATSLFRQFRGYSQKAPLEHITHSVEEDLSGVFCSNIPAGMTCLVDLSEPCHMFLSDTTKQLDKKPSGLLMSGSVSTKLFGVDGFYNIFEDLAVYYTDNEAYKVKHAVAIRNFEVFTGSNFDPLFVCSFYLKLRMAEFLKTTAHAYVKRVIVSVPNQLIQNESCKLMVFKSIKAAFTDTDVHLVSDTACFANSIPCESPDMLVLDLVSGQPAVVHFRKNEEGIFCFHEFHLCKRVTRCLKEEFRKVIYDDMVQCVEKSRLTIPNMAPDSTVDYLPFAPGSKGQYWANLFGAIINEEDGYALLMRSEGAPSTFVECEIVEYLTGSSRSVVDNITMDYKTVNAGLELIFNEVKNVLLAEVNSIKKEVTELITRENKAKKEAEKASKLSEKNVDRKEKEDEAVTGEEAKKTEEEAKEDNTKPVVEEPISVNLPIIPYFVYTTVLDKDNSFKSLLRFPGATAQSSRSNLKAAGVKIADKSTDRRLGTFVDTVVSRESKDFLDIVDMFMRRDQQNAVYIDKYIIKPDEMAALVASKTVAEFIEARNAAITADVARRAADVQARAIPKFLDVKAQHSRFSSQVAAKPELYALLQKELDKTKELFGNEACPEGQTWDSLNDISADMVAVKHIIDAKEEKRVAYEKAAKERKEAAAKAAKVKAEAAKAKTEAAEAKAAGEPVLDSNTPNKAADEGGKVIEKSDKEREADILPPTGPDMFGNADFGDMFGNADFGDMFRDPDFGNMFKGDKFREMMNKFKDDPVFKNLGSKMGMGVPKADEKAEEKEDEVPSVERDL